MDRQTNADFEQDSPFDFLNYKDMLLENLGPVKKQTDMMKQSEHDT